MAPRNIIYPLQQNDAIYYYNSSSSVPLAAAEHEFLIRFCLLFVVVAFLMRLLVVDTRISITWYILK